MHRMAALASITLTLTFGFANHAFAQSWQICNKTSESVRIVIGYAVSGGLLKSEGWWTLAPNGCQKVLNRSETVDYTTGYLYATKAGKPFINGDQGLCVDDKPFTIRRHQNCEGRNFRTVQSKQVSIDLNKNYTTNLTGSPRPGTSNFD